MPQIVDPTLWANSGGLIGLIIFALFFVLYAFSKTLSNILDKNREDINRILDLHAKEREEWGRIVDSRQSETNLAIKAMATALNKIAMRHRFEDDSHDKGLEL
jgi:hypothetical protein